LCIGQKIIVPLIYAAIIAILLNPLVEFLVRKKANRIIAITVAVLAAILVGLSLVYLISAQFSLCSQSFPMLKEKFNADSAQAILWVSHRFNIRIEKINDWIQSTETDAFNSLGGVAIGQTISTLNGMLVILVLIPVYVFMILYYKPLLLEFLHHSFEPVHRSLVLDILINSKKIIQSYLIGLLLEAAIIAVLNSMGLLLLGIDFAIILGITGALLNAIPYIGGVIAIALPMLIAFVTKDVTHAILVLAIYAIIQFIDNHLIIPRIVASKVKINALVSVIVVLIGDAIWGVPGMFLSIPLTAILKVIFDHLEAFKPLGSLLGNIVPTEKLNFDDIKKKIRK